MSSLTLKTCFLAAASPITPKSVTWALMTAATFQHRVQTRNRRTRQDDQVVS